MAFAGFKIQPSWNKSLQESDKYIWFHHYRHGSTIYHELELIEGGIVADVDNVDCELIRQNVLQLRLKNGALRTTFQSPDTTLSSVYPQEKPPRFHLTCMDVSPSGELILSASSDQTLLLFESSSGDVRRTLKGHNGEIYSCRFFPSGLVALTSGADMQLKIWCLLSGRCVASLAPGLAGAVSGACSQDVKIEPGGHRAGVLDTAILDRGRNVMAIDRIGWLRLWDVSTQICLSAIPVIPDSCFGATVRGGSVLEQVTCLSTKSNHSYSSLDYDPVLEPEPNYNVLETSSNRATEVATSDTLVAVGLGSEASVKLFELAGRTKGCVAKFTLPDSTGSAESCSFVQDLPVRAQPRHNISIPESKSNQHSGVLSQYGILVGGQNGELATWDIRQSKYPLFSLTGDKGAVQHVQAYRVPGGRENVQLYVGRSDGRLTIYSYDCATSHPTSSTTEEESPSMVSVRSAGSESEMPESFRYALELTGVNCEPLRGLCVLPGSGSTGSISVWTASFSGEFRHYQDLATDSAFK